MKKPVVTRHKAKEILRHGSVRGHALTERQQGFFGMIAGGGAPARQRHAGSIAANRAVARRRAHAGDK